MNTGTAALTGTLNLSEATGFGPGDFIVLTSAARTGTFATVNKTFTNDATTTYDAATLKLSIVGG